MKKKQRVRGEKFLTKENSVDKRYLLYCVLMILACLFLFAYHIGGYDLWAPDEPRYGEVSREMKINHNWVIPHLNNQIYYEKPPLYYMGTALFASAIGKMTVVTARLPVIFLASLLVGILAYYVGKKSGKTLGLLTGSILATTLNFALFAMRLNLDIPLIFCTTIALLLLYEETARTKSSWRSYLAFCLMGLGSLIKSPIALLPVVIILIYALLTRRWRELKRIDWIKGFLVYFGVVGIWLVAAINTAGYSYFKVTVLDQILGYSSGAEGHPNPFYYYLTTFPVEALPWSIFLIPVFYNLYKRRNQLPELVNFATLWFISAFIIFSVIGSKRGIYLLQLYPAFAILTAWYFEQHLTQLIKSIKGLRIPAVIFGLLLLLVGLFLVVKGDSLVAKVAVAPLADKAAYKFVISGLAWFAIIFGCFFGAALFHKDKRVILGVTIAFSFSLVLILKGIVMPVVNPVKSERYLAEELARQRTTNQPVGLWGNQNNDSGFIFYNGIYFDPVLKNSREAKEFLKQPGEKILVVANANSYYKSFGQVFPADWLVKKYKVGSDDMLLIKVGR